MSDNLIITGARPANVEAFKEQMRYLFKMSDLGLLSFHLGLEVKQGHDTITLGASSICTQTTREGRHGDLQPVRHTNGGPAEALYQELNVGGQRDDVEAAGG